MLSIVKSMALHGLDGYLINVETDVSGGLPYWEVVGLPDTSVKESKERVKTAIKNSGIELQSRRIIINLSPANTKKEGPFFDLPIAIGILMSIEKITVKSNELESTMFVGELSLNGNVNKVNGILPICIEAQKFGIKKVIVPKENANEAAIVDNLEIIGIENLEQVIKYLNNEINIIPQKVEIEKIFNHNNRYNIDFSEVKGQENIKRALEISAAGNHNCLLIGSPGSGKTMMARRLPTILPDLTFNESLEITKIHSIAGTLQSDVPLITTRPFRSPHHTVSSTSLVRRR